MTPSEESISKLPLLLDLLGTARRVEQAQIDALTAEDWALMMLRARQHRVLPMLRYQLAKAHTHLTLPADITAQLDATAKRTAMRALSVTHELKRINEMLNGIGVPHIFLKGAFLAYHCYPEQHLRPMRDIDILVPHDRELEVFHHLQRSGYKRMGPYHGPEEAMLTQHKHLPLLQSPVTGIFVEVHHALYHHGLKGEERYSESTISPTSDESMLWMQTIRREQPIPEIQYISPTDLLKHLIVHAVYDHEFNNGPLTLSDLAFLLKKEGIEWWNFWRRVNEQGIVKGAILALLLTEFYWGDCKIEWLSNTATLSSDMLTDTASLMLVDMNNREKNDFHRSLLFQKKKIDRVTTLGKKIFPNKRYLVLKHARAQEGDKTYLRLLSRRWLTKSRTFLPVILNRGSNATLQVEVDKATALRHWLKNE